jgi:hypothetical protein
MPQRVFAEAAVRLREGVLAGQLDRPRPPHPAQPVQQHAEHFAHARFHIERQCDNVADHHMRRQIAFTLARTPALRQHLTHRFQRNRSGDHSEAYAR